MNSALQSRRKAVLFVLQVAPEIQEPGEIGVLVREALVLLVGALSFLGRPFPGVLDGQRGSQDHHLSGAAAPAGFHDHPAQPGIDRELGQLPADRGDRAFRGQGAQFAQQRDAVRDGPGIRRFHEGEIRNVLGPFGHADRGHLQDHRGQVGAQDFRVGELAPGFEIRLGVEPDADPVGNPAATAGPLIGAGLGDPFDRQPLHFGPMRIPGDPRGPGVHHVFDAGNRQRGFRDIGGQHDPAPGSGAEDRMLLGERESGEQGQDLGLAQPRMVRETAAQGFCGIADFALAGEEDQDVARRFAGELLDRIADRVERIPVFGVRIRLVRFGFALRRVQRPVTDFHRVGPAGDLFDRGGSAGIREVLGEPFRVDRGRGDDDLQIRPFRQDLLEIAQDEIDVETAFVGLVDDQRGVFAQQFVALDFGEQDPVGHHLDFGLPGDFAGEPDLEAHLFAEFHIQLRGDPLGDRAGREPSWLGVPDQAGTAVPVRSGQTEFQAHLGNLGGFPGAGFARDDHDLVVSDGRHQLFPASGDRKLRRVGDGQTHSLPSLVGSSCFQQPFRHQLGLVPQGFRLEDLETHAGLRQMGQRRDQGIPAQAHQGARFGLRFEHRGGRREALGDFRGRRMQPDQQIVTVGRTGDRPVHIFGQIRCRQRSGGEPLPFAGCAQDPVHPVGAPIHLGQIEGDQVPAHSGIDQAIGFHDPGRRFPVVLPVPETDGPAFRNSSRNLGQQLRVYGIGRRGDPAHRGFQ